MKVDWVLLSVCALCIISHKRSILRNAPDLHCVVEQLGRIMSGSVGIWTLHRGSRCRHFVWPYWMTWASRCWRGQRGLNWFCECQWTGSLGSQARQASSSTTPSLTVSDSLGHHCNPLYFPWRFGTVSFSLQCQKSSSAMPSMWEMKTLARSQLSCIGVGISATSPRFAATAGRGRPRSWWTSTRGPTQMPLSSPSYQVVSQNHSITLLLSL